MIYLSLLTSLSVAADLEFRSSVSSASFPGYYWASLGKASESNRKWNHQSKRNMDCTGCHIFFYQ